MTEVQGAPAFLLPEMAVDRIIRRALDEDLVSGDVTTEACIPKGRTASALAVARKPLVACGGRVFARVFALVDASVVVTPGPPDGTFLPTAKAVLWSVKGSAQSVLMAERTALNLVQRMTGIATVTRRYVEAIPAGCKTRITDTRKTTPGLRVLERYAVRVGGGHNHRDNLGSAVLIKDNHVIACGGVRAAIERARAFATHTCKIECEVDSLAQLEEALAAGADIVLLDNMTNEEMAEAVALSRGRALLEASGGITLERVADLARIGLDAISVGALTHSAPAADIGLDFELDG